VGTKRTPVHRQSRMRITPEAVALFMAAEKHRDLYFACIGGGPCQRPEPGRHCDQCRTHIDASRELGRALGLKPWEASPVCPSAIACKARPRDGTMWADSLEQARELRAALEAAASGGSSPGVA
jgi:hypothetical protein